MNASTAREPIKIITIYEVNMKGKCRPQEISGNFQFILRPAVRFGLSKFRIYIYA